MDILREDILASRYDTGLTNDDDDYHLTLIIICVFSQGME
jgi:hypothetical protein